MTGLQALRRRGTFGALLRKDVLREARGREGVQAGAVLVLLFLVAFLFAFARLDDQPAAAAMALWLPLLFAGVAASGRSFVLEADAGVLPLLRQAPVALGTHGVARTVVSFALLLLIAGAAAFLGAVGWDIPVGAPLLAILALAVPGIGIVGTVAGAIAAQARTRDLLLPLLAVPILVPLMQAGIPATIAALGGASWEELRGALVTLAGFDIIAAGAAWLLWPHVLEAD